jgi:hypothetical protein
MQCRKTQHHATQEIKRAFETILKTFLVFLVKSLTQHLTILGKHQNSNESLKWASGYLDKW